MRRSVLIMGLVLLPAIAACNDGSSKPEATSTTSVETSTTTTVVVPTTTTTPTTPVLPTNFAQVDVPKIPSQTAESKLVNGKLPDGIYFGYAMANDESPKLVMEILQWFYGDACYAKVKELGLSTTDDEQCLNDYMVIDDPQTYYVVADNAYATVSGLEGPTSSYAVSILQLIKMVDGGKVASAPNGYGYTPFPYIITAKNGIITAVEQLWVP